MLFMQYVMKVHEYRGRMSASMEIPLKLLFLKGDDCLVSRAYSNKLMGIKKLATIAETLSREQQREFCKWLADNPHSTAKAIDLKLLEY